LLGVWVARGGCSVLVHALQTRASEGLAMVKFMLVKVVHNALGKSKLADIKGLHHKLLNLK